MGQRWREKGKTQARPVIPDLRNVELSKQSGESDNALGKEIMLKWTEKEEQGYRETGFC